GCLLLRCEWLCTRGPLLRATTKPCMLPTLAATLLVTGHPLLPCGSPSCPGERLYREFGHGNPVFTRHGVQQIGVTVLTKDRGVAHLTDGLTGQTPHGGHTRQVAPLIVQLWLEHHHGR